MRSSDVLQQRRSVLFGIAATVMTIPIAAQAKGLGLGSILGRASDSALDRLARPGAFYDDPDIRIGLPFVGGAGGALSSVLDAGRKAGLLDGLVRKLNAAAGMAAGEAKPIFRTAIDDLSLADVPGIVSENDGATRYLRDSASDELHGKLRPLVDTALGDLGAYRQLDRMSARYSLLGLAGINRDGLGRSVTDQGLDGIFKYIGAEEGKLRSDPLGNAGGLLKGMLGN